MKLKNAFKHFKTICIHKYWVARYCFKCGIPWQGIVHDLSKFSPTEFFESVKYYQGTSSPIDAAQKDKGYSAAWMHHRGRNKHHNLYWVDKLDEGGVAIPMPYKYAVEWICDSIGASRAYNGKDFSYDKLYKWWIAKNKTPFLIHEHTQEFISEVFYRLCFLEREKELNKHKLKTLYDFFHNCNSTK